MNLNAARMKREFEARRNAGLLKSDVITCHYMDAYLEKIDAHVMIREAYAHLRLFSNMETALYPDERIAGSRRYNEPVIWEYGWGTFPIGPAVDRWIVQEKLDAAQTAEFRRRIRLIRSRANRGGVHDVYTKEEADSIDLMAATSTFFGGHIVPDHETILSIGLEGYRVKIQTARAAGGTAEPEFYDALEMHLGAIQTYIRRYSEKAAEVAGSLEGNEKARFEGMSRDLARIAQDPPVNFRQAIQLVWIIHLLNNCDSFGKFDHYLLPFYERDIASGELTDEQALELVEALWIKVEEGGAIQNMTIGGTDGEGKPLFTGLTRICLVATREIGYKGPNLCLLTTPEMPEELWDEAIACIREGTGLPALYSDEPLYRSVLKSGVAGEDARNYSLAGCSQIQIPGKSNYVNDIGILNVAKCFELTMNNGVDPVTGIELGLKTGDIRGFASFDEVLAVFKRQMEYFCELECVINEKDVEYRRAREGYNMRTLFVQDCIGRGRGIYHGGALYSNIELECIGITNAADSLAAIRKAVFDDRKVTMAELMDALRANFEGFGELRRYLVNSVPKFGNDNDYVDSIRTEISRFIFDRFNARKTILGGIFIPGEVIFVVHESAGKAVGATPDGRLAGTVLADSAGAAQGMDRSGPTALMNSIRKIPADFAMTNIILNMRFMKKYFTVPSNASKLKTLFQSFFANGGIQAQVNVCDAETLRAAEKDPEKYASLVVRVGGYSDYYVNLSPALRAEILERTEYGSL